MADIPPYSRKGSVYNVGGMAIRALQGTQEIETCARMMAESEPWKTLGRDYNASVTTLSDPFKEVYVAVQGDDIVGFVILNMRGAFVGYIQTLCVAPELRGQGTGSILLRFAEERIFSDSPNVFMCVSSFNKGAQRLYERLGYQVVGELTDYIVEGHSEILLRKTTGPTRNFLAQKKED
ncbi:MAG: GNAT family N-acetyltransferase [Chloroflexota bacterium]|nr:GNAT family N-acetyltransferase [Chloroflexota bacterium]